MSDSQRITSGTGSKKKTNNTRKFQRRDLIEFWEQINLTPTHPVTSSDAQTLIMKMFTSVWKSYFLPPGDLRLCVCKKCDIGDICGHFPLIFF